VCVWVGNLCGGRDYTVAIGAPWAYGTFRRTRDLGAGGVGVEAGEGCADCSGGHGGTGAWAHARLLAIGDQRLPAKAARTMAYR